VQLNLATKFEVPTSPLAQSRRISLAILGSVNLNLFDLEYYFSAHMTFLSWQWVVGLFE